MTEPLLDSRTRQYSLANYSSVEPRILVDSEEMVQIASSWSLLDLPRASGGASYIYECHRSGGHEPETGHSLMFPMSSAGTKRACSTIF